jgi:hypothetical protein
VFQGEDLRIEQATLKSTRQLNHNSTELFLGQIGLHVVDAGGCYDQIVFVPWSPMVESEVPRIVVVGLLDRYPRVVTAETGPIPSCL